MTDSALGVMLFFFFFHPLHKVLFNYSSSLRANPPAYLPPTDHVIPAIHHFPLIHYHDPRWMQTNGSDFLSVCSLLASILFSPLIYPSEPQCPFSPLIYTNTMSIQTKLFIILSSTSFKALLSLALSSSEHLSAPFLPHLPSIHPSTHPPSLFLLYCLLFQADPPTRTQRSIQPMGSENPPHATLLIVTSSLPAGYNLSPSSVSILCEARRALHGTHLSLQQVRCTAN